MSVPLLSVCLITYNHVNYIRAAIEGVLMQKVNFTWELIIADDFSTDGTREIVLEYKKRHPEFIKLILQEKNVGPAQNWLDLIKAPKAKYIAYFEGDDYWTDPLKLQKQVDCLDKHDNIAICCHNVQDIYEEGLDETPYLSKGLVPESIFTAEDLIAKGWFIRASSLMFRNLVVQLPDWLQDERSSQGDFILQLLHATYGDIYYMSEVMSVYRIHSCSMTFWHSRGKVKHTGAWDKNMIFILKKYNIFSNKKFKRTINASVSKHYLRLSRLKNISLSKRIKYRFLRIYYLPEQKNLFVKSDIIKITPTKIHEVYRRCRDRIYR